MSLVSSPHNAVISCFENPCMYFIMFPYKDKDINNINRSDVHSPMDVSFVTHILLMVWKHYLAVLEMQLHGYSQSPEALQCL